MVRISQERVRRFLRLRERSQTTEEQGQALEGLICYLFGRIPGISLTMQDQLNVSRSEEIDIAFWNEKHPRGLHFLPNIVIVECKNWSEPVGSEEVNWFSTKLRNRGLAFGILIAANGVTGDALDRTGAHSIIADALREGRQIVVLTLQDLRGIADTYQLIRLFKEKLCQLIVTGTTLP